jgi:hypothetical protein
MGKGLVSEFEATGQLKSVHKRCQEKPISYWRLQRASSTRKTKWEGYPYSEGKSVVGGGGDCDSDNRWLLSFSGAFSHR